jgi:hypothetical protein
MRSKKKKKHRKNKHNKRLNKEERKRLAAEEKAFAEVLASAEIRTAAERAAALAAPTASLKNKVWTSLNAAREFISEEQSMFVNRMATSPPSRAGERKLYKVLLNENHDLLRDRALFGATTKKGGESLSADSAGHASASSAMHQPSPPHHSDENSRFVSIKSMQTNHDHRRLREKLRIARRDEAQPWMFKRAASHSNNDNTQTVSSGGKRAGSDAAGGGSGGNVGSPATEISDTVDDDDNSEAEEYKERVYPGSVSPMHGGQQQQQHHQQQQQRANGMLRLNFVHMNIAKVAGPATPERVVTARTAAKRDRREETYSRAMKIREDKRTEAERKTVFREHRALSLARGEETQQRRLAWFKLCAIGSRWQKFTELYHGAREKQIHARLEKSAASVILRGWNRKTAKKRGMVFRGAYATVQRACLKLIMRRRATVKKRSTERIMSFLCGIAVQRFRAVMLKYRTCVVKVQRYYRSFRQCKHARILALNYIWDEVETELRIIEKRNRQRRLSQMLNKLSRSSPWLNAGVRRERVIKRRRQANKVNRNASADVTGTVLDGETVDGVQFVVGDRKAALLDYHLRDGLNKIMRSNEVKAATVESVPFDIRFEVLFVLLSELRKKHRLEIMTIRQNNEAVRSRIARDEIMTLVSSLDAKGSHPMKDQQGWQKRLNSRKEAAESLRKGEKQSNDATIVEHQIEATMLTATGDAATAEAAAAAHAKAALASGNEASSSILPYPDFIVYSTLNETSLLTIVNAGRKLFEKRKMEGYTTMFENVRPLCLPRGSENDGDADNGGDEIWQQVREEEEDRQRSDAARNRRKSNMGFKIQTMSARNKRLKKIMHEKSKQEKAKRTKNKIWWRKQLPGVIVSVPAEFRSRAAKSKFVYSRVGQVEAKKYY